MAAPLVRQLNCCGLLACRLASRSCLAPPLNCASNFAQPLSHTSLSNHYASSAVNPCCDGTRTVSINAVMQSTLHRSQQQALCSPLLRCSVRSEQLTGTVFTA